MIELKLETKHVLDIPSAGYVFFLEEGYSFSKDLEKVAEAHFPALKALLKERNFTGKAGSRLMVHAGTDKKIVHLIFVGLGKYSKHLNIETYRRAVGALVRSAQSHKIASVSCALPDSKLFGVTAEHLMKQTAIIATMADYYFDDFKPENRSKQELVIHLSVAAANKEKMKLAIDDAEIIGKAVNTTRHWIDMPPSQMNPSHLAEMALSIAKKHKLKSTVFSEKEIIKMGMGGLAAVSAGSNQDAKFIVLEYHAKKNAPTIALVGKGITFDSGGLQIKPAASMATMKEDMAGAASVINAIGALAELKCSANIVAIAPTSENLPSGTATKPGDIIRFYNGKTAEVAHTDAEGRLILADALSYAVKHYKPDLMIDVATLTGACDYAIGPFYAGLFTMDDGLAEKMLQAAERSGERIWRLPLHEDYEAAFKSEVAEIMNDRKANYRAGATVGAMFLKHFVGQTPWVHLDIASNAFDVPGVSYTESGATGSSVRLLIEMAMSWK